MNISILAGTGSHQTEQGHPGKKEKYFFELDKAIYVTKILIYPLGLQQYLNGSCDQTFNFEFKTFENQPPFFCHNLFHCIDNMSALTTINSCNIVDIKKIKYSNIRYLLLIKILAKNLSFVASLYVYFIVYLYFLLQHLRIIHTS